MSSTAPEYVGIVLFLVGAVAFSIGQNWGAVIACLAGAVWVLNSLVAKRTQRMTLSVECLFLAPEHIDRLREALSLLDRVLEDVPGPVTDELEGIRNELSVHIDSLEQDDA